MFEPWLARCSAIFCTGQVTQHLHGPADHGQQCACSCQRPQIMNGKREGREHKVSERKVNRSWCVRLLLVRQSGCHGSHKSCMRCVPRTRWSEECNTPNQSCWTHVPSDIHARKLILTLFQRPTYPQRFRGGLVGHEWLARRDVTQGVRETSETCMVGRTFASLFGLWILIGDTSSELQPGVLEIPRFPLQPANATRMTPQSHLQALQE